MNQTLFILGREPALSVAEIKAQAPMWQANLAVVAREFVVVDNAPLVLAEEKKRVLDQLGGSIKEVEVLDRWPAGADATATIKTMLTAEWISQYFNDEPRVEFGVSVYGLSREKTQMIRQHGLSLKKELKALGKAVRFVDSKEPQLSAVTVQRNGLLRHGREFVLGVIDQIIFVGVTRVVQDYQAYGVRDFGRPASDPKSGMLPPKVAQMMLNIAQVKPTEVLLDPFCGSGTIIQEAALLGVKKIFASDADSQAVKNAQENIRWLFKEFPSLHTDVEITLHDARQVAVKADVIVTEPYLGKPLRGHEPESFLLAQTRELEKLYREVFQQWKKTLKPGGRVAMIWPEYMMKKGSMVLDLDNVLSTLGFRPVELIDQSTQAILGANSRTVLSYGRPDAKVRRQIRMWRV